MSNYKSTLTDDELLDGYSFTVDADQTTRPDVNYTDEELFRFASKKRLDAIDTETGAPTSVRAQVGAAQSPEDKLATLRKFYPDAVPVEVLDPENGASKFGSGNFVYTDPETGREMLFDEDTRIFGIPVPTFGDFADVGPEIAETVGAIGGSIYGGVKGGTVGATVGSPAGPVGMIGGGITGAYAGSRAGEGLGSATAREAYIKILDYFGETEDSRTGLETAVDFGTTGTINAFGGVVLNKLFTGIKNIAGRPIRIANEKMTSKSREIYERMVDQGIKPTLSQIKPDNTFLQVTNQALKNLPTSTVRMHDAARETLGRINELAAEKIQQYGQGTTAEVMARRLNQSLKNVNERYTIRSDQLYNRVRDKIPEGFRSQIGQTVKFADEFVSKAKSASQGEQYDLAVRKAQQLIEEAGQKGGLSFEELKSFRSLIREIKDEPALNGGSSQTAKTGLDALYKALTEDLDGLVRSAGKEIGDPTLFNKYARASRYVQQELGTGGKTLFARELIKKNQSNITNALKAVETGARNNVETLKQLKKGFTDDEWNDVSGYMMGVLGTKRGLLAGDDIAQSAGEITFKGADNFSPATFLTNLDKMSPEAKTILFGGKKNKQLLKELNALQETIRDIGKDAAAMGNPSGTARVGGMMAFLVPGATFGGAGFDMGLAGLAVPWMSAKLMTNPDFVRWMATGVSKSVYDPNSFADHVRRLAQIWQANPEIREEIQAILPQLQAESLEPIPEHASANQAESEGQFPTQTQAERNFAQRVPASMARELLPNRDELMSQMNQMAIPDVDPMMPIGGEPSLPTFEPLESLAQGFSPMMGGGEGDFSTSAIVLPNAGDREIAMRQQEEEQGGIASLG